MRKMFCDLCGKAAEDDFNESMEALRENKAAWLEAHRRGQFYVEYSRAITDEKGTVQRMTGEYDFRMCPECRDRIEAVIWNEVDKILEEAKMSPSRVALIAPDFPRKPMVDETIVKCAYTCGEVQG